MTEYMPHGMCLLWDPVVMLSMAVCDGLIALAYFVIPCLLVWFLKKHEKGYPFPALIWFFAAFITGCGMTHVMDIINLVYPMYRLDVAIRAVTAALSVATAVAVLPTAQRVFLWRSNIEGRVHDARHAIEGIRSDLDAD